MSLRNLALNLEHLTYNEMMLLSRILTEQLKDRNRTLSDSLSGLPIKLMEACGEDKVIQQEAVILRRVFNVKRTLTISSPKPLYTIDAPSISTPIINCQNLREGMNTMLDNIIAMHALTGGK